MGLRYGIIGTNFISDRFADAVKQTDSEVTAVFSRTAEKGSAFAENHGIREVYSDFDKFLKSDFDAVYVATPNYVHASQTITALKAGKHVLCEKPIASNLREFNEMRATASECGRVFLEAMRPVFDPALEAVKSSLPKLGIIRRAVIDFSQYSSRYDKYKNGEILNAFMSELSNAAVMDIGVYCIADAVYLFGKPNGVKSESVFLDNGFEGLGTALFAYDGFTVEIKYSKISDTLLPNYIEGENGTLVFTKTSQPRDISIRYRDGSTENITSPVVENNMIYEVNTMDLLVKSGDIHHEYNDSSEVVISLIDEIRRQNGIVFPADK